MKNDFETEKLNKYFEEKNWKRVIKSKIPTWKNENNTEGIEYRNGKLIPFSINKDERIYLDAFKLISELENYILENSDNNIMSEYLTKSDFKKIGRLSPKSKLSMFQKTDKRFIKKKTGNNGKIIYYVEGHYIHQVLNLISSFRWDSYVDGFKETDKEVICWGRIRVKIGEDIIEKSAVGQAEKREGMTLGDIFKAAQTDMEKKAASKLGIAADVYRGDIIYEKMC